MQDSETLPKKRNIIPKETWALIEEGCKNGLPLSVLAEKYGVKERTILTVSSTKGWLTPSNMVKTALKRATKDLKATVSDEIIAAMPREVNWQEEAANYRQMIFGKTKGALEIATLEPPKTWRDAEIADRMARKAVGLESGETTVVQTIIPIGKGDFGVERDVSPTPQA